MPTDMDIYLFDLRGYLILKNALTADEVAALNAGIDEILPLGMANGMAMYTAIPMAITKARTCNKFTRPVRRLRR